jgi:hypothetical protein
MHTIRVPEDRAQDIFNALRDAGYTNIPIRPIGAQPNSATHAMLTDYSEEVLAIIAGVVPGGLIESAQSTGNADGATAALTQLNGNGQGYLDLDAESAWLIALEAAYEALQS